MASGWDWGADPGDHAAEQRALQISVDTPDREESVGRAVRAADAGGCALGRLAIAGHCLARENAVSRDCPEFPALSRREKRGIRDSEARRLALRRALRVVIAA